MDWKTCPLELGWLNYWRTMFRIIADGGTIATSVAIFQVNRPAKSLTVIAHAKDYPNSKEAILNERCVSALGWKMLPIVNAVLFPFDQTDSE